jgi:hypothetical protein
MLTVKEIKTWAKNEQGWFVSPKGNWVKLGDGVTLGNWVTLGDGVTLGDASPPYLMLNRYPIYWSAPGVIGSGCIQKPYTWWSDDNWRGLRFAAAENHYTPSDIDLYIMGFEYVWNLSEKLGLNKKI